MMAAHVAAMAPGTNLGAAHPVALGGLPVGGQAAPDSAMMAKVTNDAVAYVRSLATERGRNADWANARFARASRFPATRRSRWRHRSRGGRPRQPDGGGRRARGCAAPGIHAPRDGGRDLDRDAHRPARSGVGAIANPSLAYLLLLLGALGIFFELSHPGTLFPGIVGAISLLLSFFALQMLPVRGAGVALILLSIILFILEIKVTSYGALAIGGVASLLFGSLMLSTVPRACGSPWVSSFRASSSSAGSSSWR